MFLKWFWKKVTNIQAISEITKNNFSVTPVGVYSRPHAQSLLSHICISVLAILSNIDCCAIFFTLLIVLLIWTTLLYTSISFSVSSTVHECFQSSFCSLLLLCKYCILSLSFEPRLDFKKYSSNLRNNKQIIFLSRPSAFILGHVRSDCCPTYTFLC